MTEIVIREATIEDSGLILGFIRELARYEKAERQVLASVEDIESSLFGEGASANALIGCSGEQAIGFAVYFFNYSTWQGKNGLYLEDLYVTPEYRGIGAGKKLLQHLAKLALAHQCGRFEWSVLDWNEPAIRFYESIGARAKPEWIGYRLDGDELEAFARG